ncbi:hypothetical protein ACQEU8_11530 [Streptomyces sp. CA-250714]|uniref:hypothetical protein n=1 Tax=Streptomyces sp. CA-250714 TaxID=3240060 RepID=UPI003D8BA406
MTSTDTPRAFVTSYEGQPCSSCNGSGSQTETDTSGGVYREYMKPCTGCNGSGQV